MSGIKITQREAEGVQTVCRQLYDLLEDGEDAFECAARAVCRYNQNLEYDEVYKDLKRAAEGRELYKRIYENLSHNPAASVTEQLEKEFPEGMTEEEKKGYYMTLYSIFSLKDEGPEEVAERAGASLDEQREMLERCVEECSENLLDSFAETLYNSQISGLQPDGTDAGTLGVEGQNPLLYMASVYTAAQSGIIQSEWAQPEMLGIMTMCQETLQKEGMELPEGQEEEFAVQIVKLVLFTLICVLAAVLLMNGLEMFADMMLAEEAGLAGAEFAAHVVLEMAGSAIIFLSYLACLDMAVLSGLYTIYLILEKWWSTRKLKNGLIEQQPAVMDNRNTEDAFLEEDEYEYEDQLSFN